MKNFTSPFVALVAIAILVTSCNRHSNTETATLSTLQTKQFDTIIDGKKVGLYQIENKNHVTAAFTNFGGRIISLSVPDQEQIK